MKCSNCGGELIINNGIGVCSSCKSPHRLDDVFENIDVCICYIENDRHGRRTKDSLIAAEVYKKLESKKINCFYERISAGNVTGDDLEKIRYSAISHAKIIALVGTDTDNFSALYDKYSEVFGDKRLIPIISDMKPEQLPEKLRRFQASNFDSFGALNDLSTSVLNLLGRGKEVELEEIYNKKQKKKKILAGILAAILCAAGALAFVFWPGKEEPAVLTNEEIYNYANQLLNEEKYLDAAAEFGKILDYKDSRNQYKKIYDHYDGYYQDEDQTSSLYLNIVDGKTAEFSFEKIVDKKIVKIEDSMVIENNRINGNFIDNLSNEGDISIALSNDLVALTVSTKAAAQEISIGDFSTQFDLKNKTDRPPIKTVTKEILQSWVSELTYVDDIKTSGYELEYIEVLDDVSQIRFGTQYKIANTDIIIITTNNDLTEYAGDYPENMPQLDKSVVFAIIAPVDLACPERIGKSACVFSEEGIAYVPNTDEFAVVYDSNEQLFFDFLVDGDYSSINVTDTRTMSELTIKADSMVGMCSKRSIGEYNYNTIIRENKNIYYKTLAVQQYQNDNPNESGMSINPYVIAENSGALLINVQTIERTALQNGSYNYYRCDLSTEKCTFIVTQRQVSYINQYGSISYSYDGWVDYPEYFGEFIRGEFE